ncbi:MAG: hypothetical protein CME16_03345 [Gemmatimonadetes bacterium]|nr:hypothetical protein [Gemmatimonadota bacterium]
MKFALALSAICTFFVAPVFSGDRAPSSPPAPLEFIRRYDAQACSIMAQTAGDSLAPKERHQLKEHINSAFDFAELGKLALGAHWESRNAEEKALFLATFASIVGEQNFTSFVDCYNEKIKVNFLDEEVKENKALVRAEVPARNDTVDIVYLMHRRQGKWRVYDLVIDDASTATGYRKRYARFLAKKSFQQLLARLGEQRQRLLVP